MKLLNQYYFLWIQYWKQLIKLNLIQFFNEKLNADLIDGKISIGRHSNERNLHKMKNKKIKYKVKFHAH